MQRRARRTLAMLAALLGLLATASPARGARIKDITDVQGIRSNDLYGFGLVVGLAGSGADSDLTAEVVQNMLERLRVGRGLAEIDASNVAAVMVTAELPPFARKGSRIDVTVSALDKTSSLRGGTLLLTPLVGADGEVYAVAQGAITVGGFSFAGEAASVQQGHPTVGRIPSGAHVERQVPTTFLEENAITLALHTPDFATATRIASTIARTGGAAAETLDAGTVKVAFSSALEAQEVMRRISEVQLLEVVPDARAVVVINERTGTVVAGQNVSISSVAVSHGNLTVVTQELPEVVQPQPFGEGTTETVERTALRITESPLPEQEGGLTVLNRGPTVNEVARALNLLGASPRDIISIFQAIKEAGALHAELRIM
jgi:flagellar P-ring protein precursor FlgI